MMILLAVLAVCAGLLALLWNKYRALKKQLDQIADVLDDIEKGYGRRKLLTEPEAPAAEICFQINRIVGNFNDKLAMAEKQEKTYKSLLTSLSHDLRTPLASLIGYLEAVDENYIAEEKKPGYIKIAKHKAYDLKELINTLFEWFKLDAKEKSFAFTVLDAGELTREEVAAVIPLLEQAGMHYHISVPDEPLMLSLDEDAYRRILDNLVQNAITHSGGSDIFIALRETAETVCLTVRDNGIGIGEEDIPYIFDRLYKCDRARTGKGNGLGLAIVKSLVEAHGGSIEAASEKGKGSQFMITIPKAVF